VQHICCGLKFLKLALLLWVAIASVEHVFSATKVVNNQLCNKISEWWLIDRLVTYIERNVLLKIRIDVSLSHFQQMDRRQFPL